MPIQIEPCDGSEGQKWDFITAGKHNNKPGFALIVSSLVILVSSFKDFEIYLFASLQTNACLNFDDRQVGITGGFKNPRGYG